MATDYGIGFCKQGIRELEAAEDKLFESTGEGFRKFSKEAMQLVQYRTLLRRFEQEKSSGRMPSYNPDIHGKSRE